MSKIATVATALTLTACATTFSPTNFNLYTTSVGNELPLCIEGESIPLLTSRQINLQLFIAENSPANLLKIGNIVVQRTNQLIDNKIDPTYVSIAKRLSKEFFRPYDPGNTTPQQPDLEDANSGVTLGGQIMVDVSFKLSESLTEELTRVLEAHGYNRRQVHVRASVGLYPADPQTPNSRRDIGTCPSPV